jgi:uncharacterized protein YneF (UPF0154 family)
MCNRGIKMALLIMIIISVLIVSTIAGLAGVIISRRWFPQLDNINNAIVFVKNGKSYTVKKGLCISTTDKGKVYRYDTNKVCHVKIETEDEYIKHNRVIVLSGKGKIIGTTISDTGKVVLQSDEQQSIIQHLTLGHIGVEMLKAMTSAGNAVTGMIILFVVIALIVGALAGFGLPKLFQKQPPTQLPQTGITHNVPNPTIVITPTP